MPRNARPGTPTVAVGYLRCSKSTEQHLSPDAQRSQIDAYATREGLTIAAWFTDDGVSGGADVTQRPALLAALAALREHGAGVLLVLRRDRVARDPYIALTIERAVAAAGARILAADGAGNGDDPSAVLLRGMLDLFAAHERSMCKARTRAALATKKARGERVGTIPYGFAAGPDGKLVPNEAEQGVIACIRDLRAAGLSLRAIEAELAKRGVVSRSGQHPLSLPTICKLAKVAA